MNKYVRDPQDNDTFRVSKTLVYGAVFMLVFLALYACLYVWGY